MQEKLAEKREEERIRTEAKEAEQKKMSLIEEENRLKKEKKDLEGQMMVADKMCLDASEKLDKAIKSNSPTDISVASKMIQTGNNLRADTAKKICDVDGKLEAISKKRSDMIGKLLKRQATASTDPTPSKQPKKASSDKSK